MLALWKREFFYLCKGIKAIIILSIFIGFTYIFANLEAYIPTLMRDAESSSALSGGLRLLVLFFGFIFVSVVSHDILTKEVDTKTIRFLVTKTSRFSIVLGKFLGVLSFWIVVITLSYVPVFLKAETIDYIDYIRLVQLIILMVSFTIFISTLVRKPSYSLLIGLCFGVIYPVIGTFSMFESGVFWDKIRFISLFNYIQATGHALSIPLFVSICFLIISLCIFYRRDL